MQEPKTVVRLAEPGEVTGYGRLTSSTDPQPDYVNAAELALRNPKRPVIVHEWELPKVYGQPGAPDYADAEANQVRDEKELGKYVAAEAKAQQRRLNDKLHAENASVPVADRVAEGTEPFAVSTTLHRPDKVYRSVVVFHPEGRPVRTRKAKAADEVRPDPADGPADDEEA